MRFTRVFFIRSFGVRFKKSINPQTSAITSMKAKTVTRGFNEKIVMHTHKQRVGVQRKTTAHTTLNGSQIPETNRIETDPKTELI